MSDILSTIQATIFVRRTIAELLFEGYDDLMMDIGSSFNKKEDEYGEKEKNWFDADEDEENDFSFSENEYDDSYNGFGFGDENYGEKESDVKEEGNVESTGSGSERVPMDKFGWFYKVSTGQSLISPHWGYYNISTNIGLHVIYQQEFIS